MPPEIIDHGVPRVLEGPETDLQPKVDLAAKDHSQSPTVSDQELGADAMSLKEATLDLPKSDGDSNPDNEPTPSQETIEPVPTVGEDEEVNEVPQEAGDSGDDDFLTFEGGLPKGRIASSVAGRPPPKPKPRPK